MVPSATRSEDPSVYYRMWAGFIGCVVSSAMRSEDPSVYYRLCAGFMGCPWRELWPRKAAKTGSISRGTNFEKSRRDVGTFIFVCEAFFFDTHWLPPIYNFCMNNSSDLFSVCERNKQTQKSCVAPGRHVSTSRREPCKVYTSSI